MPEHHPETRPDTDTYGLGNVKSPVFHLSTIFMAALARVDPYRMIVDHMTIEDNRLSVAFETEHHTILLDDFDRILVLGAGKGSARMARAVEDILGDRLSQGLVVTKYGHGEPLTRIEVIEAAHPMPDEAGIVAARRIAALAEEADERTLVLTLLSGGGSALLCAPFSDPVHGISLDLADKQAVTGALLASGADIGEMNCVRKHLSSVKGGRLMRLLAPARSLTLILSDVVGDRLDTIASGPTYPDETSFSQALAILDKYGLKNSLPSAVREVLALGVEGRIPETPKNGDQATALVDNILIGTNMAALSAARDKGRELGYEVIPLTSSLTGEAREVAKVLFSIAKDIRDRSLLAHPPVLLLAGGETTVTLKGSGRGGRNQEMALAFLAEMEKDEQKGENIIFLSASTDGSDGPTDATGAFASTDILKRARDAGLSIRHFLAANDSYHFFAATGDLFKTGPTMTNVCDLHMVLIV